MSPLVVNYRYCIHLLVRPARTGELCFETFSHDCSSHLVELTVGDIYVFISSGYFSPNVVTASVYHRDDIHLSGIFISTNIFLAATTTDLTVQHT